jgi:hypothetical protein
MGASIFFTAAMIRAFRLARTRGVRPTIAAVTSQARIIAAVKNIEVPTLTRVWQELEYRIDVCRVTRGANIKHL